MHALKMNYTRLGMVFVMMLIIIGGLWCLIRYSPTLNVAQEWNGIIPGHTISKEVIALWGQPTEVLTRTGVGFAGQVSWQIGKTSPPEPVYTIYQYVDTDWGEQEVWILNGKVVGIMVMGQWADLVRVADPVVSFKLKAMTYEYGRPDVVLWAHLPRHRCLVWARSGLLGHTVATPEINNQHNPSMLSIFWFEPMTKRQFLHTKWPWPLSSGFSCAVSNQYITGDAPDRLSQDPYDWDMLLIDTSDK